MHVAVVHLLFSVATQCRDNWYYYNGNCYYPSTEEATQSDARAKCQAMDADLTSIIDEKEKDFVLSISYELKSHLLLHRRSRRGFVFGCFCVSNIRLREKQLQHHIRRRSLKLIPIEVAYGLPLTLVSISVTLNDINAPYPIL